MKKLLAAGVFLALAPVAFGGQYDATIPMTDKGSISYYVQGHIDGAGDTEFMVDTGSSYMTINEETLAALKKEGNVRYVRKLRGRLANGAELEVPVYSVKTVRIGSGCHFSNVEAAVFPGKTRQILGLSALSEAAPFVFSMDPPSLVLSHCTKGPGQELAAAELQRLP
ncbi:retropepsin-like aspartic protease family protein [Thiohalomonas denitrificans]|uniref:retropepsin-like aspartic protease family protein n=1 Tax=Thiohalomonas denitrificans TaxID=415747 RepID=UPI001FDED7A3|nr:retropepsin-like aspartic protease [Thiohalomonas denitrificans]